MPLHNSIRAFYEDIFKSFDSPSLEKHIERINDLDTFLPHNSTFFCVTNSQDLSFDFISKNMYPCLGIDPELLRKDAMRYFWSRIHPEDVKPWLEALNALMKYTLEEVDPSDRDKMSYTWNYRFKNGNDEYVNIIQNTTPLEFDSEMKPVMGLAHYTVLNQHTKLNIIGAAKFLNANNEYENRYYNDFSQKALTNSITNRERDVVRLLVLNHTSKEIANRLNISSNTVDTHRRNILKKLKVSTTGELVGILKSNVNLI